MSYSYKYIVEYKDHEKVTCIHKESGTQDSVNFNQISLPDGRISTYNDISSNDTLTVIYQDNRRISITLSKLLAPVFQAPPKSMLISQFQDIQSVPIMNQSSIKSLYLFFSSFREVRPSSFSLNLSFFISLLDQSIIYRFQESFKTLWTLHDKFFYYISLEKSQVRSLLIFQELNQILINPEDIPKKLENVRLVYDKYKSDIETLVNHSVKLAALTEFHKDTKPRTGRDLQVILQAASTGTFELSDFQYLVNLLNVELRVIEAKDLTITIWGKSSDLVLTLLKTETSEFIPIYSKQVTFLAKCTNFEFDSAFRFFNTLNTVKTEQDQLRALVNSQKGINSKLAQSLKNLLKHSSMTDYAPGQIDSGLIEENSDFLCSSCKIIGKVADYPCGHSFCEECSRFSCNESFYICKICNFWTSPSEVNPQYS